MYAASTAKATPSSSKQQRIQMQLKRYYHADGYIKAIGHAAYRTIYNSNPIIRFKWGMKVHHLISVRKDASHKLEILRTPPKPDIDSCTNKLLAREGGYNPHSYNSSTGAYGGPQALPGSKMASAGDDWADNIWTQIKWMKGYMNSRYGGSCNALAHSYSYGWY